MKRHITLAHDGQKSFEACGAIFGTKENLNVQNRSVHEGKKPFKCKICQATFSHLVNFNVHINSVHEETKPLDVTFVKSLFLKKEF